MDRLHFEYQWPRDNLFIDCFIHEVFNYRYHWHSDLYELDIVLGGALEFCADTSSIFLEENDVVLIPPGTGHASSALQPNTRTLVLHFQVAAFKPYLKKEEMFLFPECRSSKMDRDSEEFRELRFYAANILKGAYSGGKIENLRIKGAVQMLLFLLLNSFHPQIVRRPSVQEDEKKNETLRRMIAYLEEHYPEKVTLEDLAQYTKYNRTYISTLFKNTVGIGFHEYLTRLRFQQALFELATTSDTLTDIAIRNGFSDLKSFNAHFREVLHRTPQEYRRELIGRDIAASQDQRKYIPKNDEMVQKKLNEFTSFILI